MNLVPMVVEQRSEVKEVMIFFRLLKERIILLLDPINDRLSSLVCAPLLFLESESKDKDIYMYIGSHGR